MSTEFNCLVRFTGGALQDSELPAIDAAAQRIRAAVEHVCEPVAERFVGAALLTVAIDRLLHERGTQATAMTLIRLIDSVLEHGERRAHEHAASSIKSAIEDHP